MNILKSISDLFKGSKRSERKKYLEEDFEGSFEILSYTDEYNRILPVSEMDKEETEIDHFMYFNDDNQVSNAPTDVSESSFIFKAPNKVGLTSVIAMATVCANLIVSGTALYITQTNFNSRVLERLDTVEHDLRSVNSAMYTKAEEDLMFQNFQLELKNQRELINLIKEEQRRNR